MIKSNAAEKLADAVIETYFQLLDKPLPGWMRLLCAWAGAATVSGSTFITGAGLKMVLDNADKTWVVILVAVVAPAVPGLLIASARTRHGPVRLYISGMLLSSFIAAVAVNIWSVSSNQSDGGHRIEAPAGEGSPVFRRRTGRPFPAPPPLL